MSDQISSDINHPGEWNHNFSCQILLFEKEIELNVRQVRKGVQRGKIWYMESGKKSIQLIHP